MIENAPSDIQDVLSNLESPIVLKQQYPHEDIGFIRELCGKIQGFCSRIETGVNDDGYLVFLSHYTEEAAPVARLVQRDLERRLVARQDENLKLLKGARIFLDCDYLIDLRRLEGEVRKSKVLFAFLTKDYFTRPWCLAELYYALKAGVPIIPINIIGGGHDFEKGRRFLSTLTPQSLSAEASATLAGIGIDVTQLGKDLCATIPPINAVTYNPREYRRTLDAKIDEMIDRILECDSILGKRNVSSLNLPESFSSSSERQRLHEENSLQPEWIYLFLKD
jgi:hypothetical protein